MSDTKRGPAPSRATEDGTGFRKGKERGEDGQGAGGEKRPSLLAARAWRILRAAARLVEPQRRAHLLVH